jgi:hypothetical protein
VRYGGRYSHKVVVLHETLLVAGEEAEEREDQGCGAAYCWDEGCEAHRDGVSKYAPCKMVLLYILLPRYTDNGGRTKKRRCE